MPRRKYGDLVVMTSLPAVCGVWQSCDIVVFLDTETLYMYPHWAISCIRGVKITRTSLVKTWKSTWIHEWSIYIFFLLCWSSHQGCKRPFKIKPNQTESDWAQFSSRINQILLYGSAISKPIKPQTNGTQSNSDWVWQPSSNEHNLDNNYWLHSILWMICLNKDHVTWSQKQKMGG